MERNKADKKTKFFVRVLSTEHFSHDDVVISPDCQRIDIRCRQQSSRTPDYWRFQADGVLYNLSQEKIYAKMMTGVAEDAIAGQNAVVLSYGQTGSGKSLTVNGLRNLYEDRGVVPRFIEELHDIGWRRRDDMEVCFKMSYVDFLPGRAVDLLSSRSGGNITISDIDADNILRVLFRAESKRVCRDSPYQGVNVGSSVLTLHVCSRDTLVSMAPVRNTVVQFIDLAGIDTIGTDSSNWKSNRDIGHANVTKIFLQKFFATLNSKKKFITSDKILNYISDSFASKGTVRVTLIAHVKASRTDLNLTLSVLKLGSEISGKTMERVRESLVEAESDETKSRRELEEMCKRLVLSAMVNNQSDFSTVLCKTRYDVISKEVEGYVRGFVHEIHLTSVAHVLMVLQSFRAEFEKLAEENVFKMNEYNDIRKSLEERYGSLSKSEITGKRGSTGLKKNSKVKRDTSKSSKKSESIDVSKRSSKQSMVRGMKSQPIKSSKTSLGKSSSMSLKKGSKGSISLKKGSMSLKKGSMTSMSLSRSSKRKESVVNSVDLQPTIPLREIDRHGITIGPGFSTSYQAPSIFVRKYDRMKQAELETSQDNWDFDDEISLKSTAADDECLEFSQPPEKASPPPAHSDPPEPHPPEFSDSVLPWTEVLRSGIPDRLERCLESDESRALEELRAYVDTARQLRAMRSEIDRVEMELLDMECLQCVNGDEFGLNLTILHLVEDLAVKQETLSSLKNSVAKQRTSLNQLIEEISSLTKQQAELKRTCRLSVVTNLPDIPRVVEVEVETCDESFRNDAVFSRTLTGLVKTNLK